MDPRRPVAGFELTPDLLAAQGQALRRLARSLLRDAHAAEDVVQEAWVASLRRPGFVPESLSAWLGSVTRRMALRRMRDDGRRRAREHRRATSEVLAAVQQRELEREEAIRGVTAALLALEEPFKTTLLLRYYEDRTPHEIADELGVPLATVKSRLARGLEKLRERLGREHGNEGRGRALALLAGVPTSAGNVAVGTLGGLWMGAKLKVGLVAMVLAGSFYLVWRAERDPIDRPTVGPSSAEPRGALAAALEGGSVDQRDEPEASEAGTGREALKEEETPAAPLASFPAEPGFEQVLRGRVRDEHDLPLPGARIRLAPRGLAFQLAAVTDEEGRFEVRFDTRRPLARLALEVTNAKGEGPGPCEIELRAGQPFEIDLGLQAAELEEVLFLRAFKASGLLEIAPVLSDQEGGDWLVAMGSSGDGPTMAAGADGKRHFVESWPPASCTREKEEAIHVAGQEMTGQLLETLVLQDSSLAYSEVVLWSDAKQSSFEFEAPATPEPAPAGAVVRGIVRAPDGTLLSGVEIGYGPPNRALVARVLSDEQGLFELADVPPGELRLRARSPDGLGRCEERMTFAAGESVTWNPLLVRGNELTGRVLLPDATPLVGAEIELWERGPARLFRAVARTNEDGRFAFGHLAPRTYELHVRAPDRRFPVRVVENVSVPGEIGTLQLGAKELEHRALVVRLEDGEGANLSGEIRVWHAATGRASLFATQDESGRFVCANLPRGLYRVEVRSAFGWQDLGSTWLEDEDVDLGRAPFPRPGLLSLAAPTERDEELTPMLSLWSVHPDVFARLEELDPTASLVRAARPAEYRLCSGPAGAGFETPLTVTSGRTTALDLDGPRPPRPASTPPIVGTAQACAACHAD